MKISITSHSSSSFFFALFFFCWRFYYTLNHWIAFVVIYLVMIIRVCRSWQHTHPKSFEKTHFYLCVYLSEGVCLLWKERRNYKSMSRKRNDRVALCCVRGLQFFYVYNRRREPEISPHHHLPTKFFFFFKYFHPVSTSA